MDHSYPEAVTALNGQKGLNNAGVARWPHHQITFRYPNISLLQEGESLSIPLPANHTRRSIPARSRYTYDGPLSLLSLVDNSDPKQPHRQKGRATRAHDRSIAKSHASDGLAAAIGTAAQHAGRTDLTAVTFTDKHCSDRQLFRIERTTVHLDGREQVRTTYTYTTQQFYNLHEGAECLGGKCLHWWHYLESLVTRSSDLTFWKVQDYADGQDISLPTVHWRGKNGGAGTVSGSAASSSPGIWETQHSRFSRYDEALPDQSKRPKGSRREVWVDRDKMTDGIDFLLRLARNREIVPQHLNPASSNEAAVMGGIIRRVVDNRHGWSLAPREFRELLVNEVYRGLAATAVPQIDFDEVRRSEVPVSPGFGEFLDVFATRFVNWCLDEDREYQHVFRGASLGGVGHATESGEVQKGDDSVGTRRSKRKGAV